MTGGKILQFKTQLKAVRKNRKYKNKSKILRYKSDKPNQQHLLSLV